MKAHHLLGLAAGSIILCMSSTATAVSQIGSGSSRVQFVSVPGERVFSGRMISRPMPIQSLEALGLDRDGIRNARATARSEMARFAVLEYVRVTDEYIFEVPSGKTESEVANQLLSLGCFQYVEPDWILFPVGCPDDTRFGSQWHHQANRLQSCAGWDLHTGNPTVSVGICDTGVLTTHEDLQLHRLEGYNAVDRVWESAGGNIGPVHPHGTMTTGCAAANGNNGKGVAGMGWNLSHRMMRVSNISTGNAYSTDLQHAARTAVEAGDRVASVSYSGPDSSSNLTTATYIKSIGGLLIWAAGNDGRNLTYGNRDNDDLIVAGATDEGDGLAYFSAYGQFVDVTAPGVNVWTTDSGNNSDYAGVNGTSFACPLTAGMCAMIWSADPSLTPDEVESILKQSCDDLGTGGVDNTFAYGRINLLNAMTLAVGGGGTPPVADFVGAPTSGVAPLTVTFGDLSTNSPTNWSWNFGDGGSSNLQNPSHTYTGAGTFSVSLLVANADGSDTLVRTDYITVDPAPGNPPIAEFAGTPTSGTEPLTVGFTDLSSNSPTSWTWVFGDGGSSNLQNPSHVYIVAGTYSVSLLVVTADGSDTLLKSDYITVDPAPGSPPIADFVGTPTSGTTPLTVTFTDLSTNAPTSWSWNFGDGQTSTSQHPVNVYGSAGDYTVSLTVSNADGSDTMTLTNYISVSDGGGFQGTGFILSKNADFSSDDRVFSRSDTLYMLLWSDAVDLNDITSRYWELRARKVKLQQDLTNNGDGSFTAAFDLSGLPSNVTSYSWKARVTDGSGFRYTPKATLTVQ